MVFLLNHYESKEIVNVGWGIDVTIRELCELVMAVVGYTGRLIFDASKPDGSPRKLLDTGRLTSLGWKPRIELRSGIEQTYAWYRENMDSARR